MSRPITKAQLDALENVVDRVFANIGIDVEFTRHFLDRVNDERNRKQITIRELGELFAKEYRRWGREIAKMPVDTQAVMKDLSSELNIPFVLNPDGKETDLVAKTVMRKKNFRTPNKTLPVESVIESDNDFRTIAQSAIDYLENLKAKHSNNYGMVSSIDNRISPLKGYLRRNDERMVMDLLKNDDYLGPWRDETKIFNESQHEADSHFEFQGRNRGTSTWKSDDGRTVQLSTWTDYKKTGRNSRLRDPSGTKWKLQIREGGQEVFYKVVGKAEDMESRPRKQRAVKAALKFLEKEYGIDAYEQLWIEGGLPKPDSWGEVKETHGAKRGTQVKGRDATPSKRKPTKGGETPHPMRGKLVGEEAVIKEASLSDVIPQLEKELNTAGGYDRRVFQLEMARRSRAPGPWGYGSAGGGIIIRWMTHGATTLANERGVDRQVVINEARKVMVKWLRENTKPLTARDKDSRETKTFYIRNGLAFDDNRHYVRVNTKRMLQNPDRFIIQDRIHPMRGKLVGEESDYKAIGSKSFEFELTLALSAIDDNDATKSRYQLFAAADQAIANDWSLTDLKDEYEKMMLKLGRKSPRIWSLLESAYHELMRSDPDEIYGYTENADFEMIKPVRNEETANEVSGGKLVGEGFGDNLISRKTFAEIMALKTDAELAKNYQEYVINGGKGKGLHPRKLTQVQQAINYEIARRKEHDAMNEESDDSFVKQFVKDKRREGWSVYASRINHGVQGAHRLEFEKDGNEFEVVGSGNHWELFHGPSLSGRGEKFDGLDTAFQTAAQMDEAMDQPPLDVPTMSVEEIADHHGVPVEQIEQQLEIGIEVEMEHTTDPEAAKEIALDHLKEMPDYYDELATIEPHHYTDESVRAAWQSYQMDEKIRDPREAMLDMALKFLDRKVHDDHDRQSLGGLAMDVAREVRLNQIGVNHRDLARLYRDWKGDSVVTEGWMEGNLYYLDEVIKADENFQDGKVKGKSRPGRAKRAGVDASKSVSALRKQAKNSSGEEQKMAHWAANMKAGRQKKKK